jgi:hypothetical protein
MAMNAAYVASKHAVLGLARGVALELAPFGVRCNCVVPGFIETPMLDALPPDAAQAMAVRVPQGRTGSADELAHVAAFCPTRPATSPRKAGQSMAACSAPFRCNGVRPMALTYYHAEPVANSLKSMIAQGKGAGFHQPLCRPAQVRAARPGSWRSIPKDRCPCWTTMARS